MGFLSYCIIIYDKKQIYIYYAPNVLFIIIILKGRSSKKIRDPYGKGGAPKELWKVGSLLFSYAHRMQEAVLEIEHQIA